MRLYEPKLTCIRAICKISLYVGRESRSGREESGDQQEGSYTHEGLCHHNRGEPYRAILFRTSDHIHVCLI